MKRMSLRWLVLATLVWGPAGGVLLLLATAFPIAAHPPADPPNDPDLIHACAKLDRVNPSVWKKVRIVGPEGSCKTTEVPVHWPAVGASVPVLDVVAVQGQDLSPSPGASFVDLPGATTTVAVPAGATVLVRFSAESNCTGNGRCIIQFLVGGVPLTGGIVFDSTADGDFESHSMEASTTITAAGDIEVKIQWRTFASATFDLDEWTLSVTVFRP